MKRVLLIEDHDLVRQVLRVELERWGYEVLEARDGKEGLHLYTDDVAAVLTDLVMPGKEGIETILELKQRNPAVKIIAMSGGGRVSGASYLAMAGQLGAQRVLAKPFSEVELQDALLAVAGPGEPAPKG